MLETYIKPTIYLVLIIIIIILFYCCYHYRIKTKHECFHDNKIYEIPDQLTTRKAKALVLSCMDFRLIDDQVYHFNKMGYTNNYDSVVLAGASLGYNQTKYPEWRKMLDEHIELSIQLHKIEEIIVLEHMDCGAYKLFYNDSITDENEFGIHKNNVREFKNHINEKFPTLTVRSFLMRLNGSVMKI